MNKALPDAAGPVRSPTEILERLKELQQDLGAPFGRISTEGIVPCLQKTMFQLSRKGVVPTVKGRALKLNSGYVRVQFQSPLAQAQNLSEVETSIKWMQWLQSLGPEVFALNCNLENAGAIIGRKMGVPNDLIRSDDNRVKLQQVAGMMLAKQQQAGQAGGAVGATQGAPQSIAA